MEELLKQQRLRLLQQGVPDSDDENRDEPQWHYETEDHLDEVEDDWLIKFPRPIRHRQRNSRRTPSWPWSPRRWPHTCLSNITTDLKETPEQRISPCVESHFSKRRSESRSESESGSQSDSRNENKEKTNKVSAINKSKTESRMKLEGCQDKVREVQTLKDSILKFPFHRHLTATCTISLFIFNFIILDHFDHHFTYPFRRFTLEDLKDCKKHFNLQTKALHWAKTEQTHPAILDSTRLHKTPETRPNLPAKDLHMNTLVSVILHLAGRLRISQSNPQFCLNFYSYT
jgi:hypothetical protein